MTLPLLSSPPLQPLSPAALRFLTLHVKHLVTSHRWYFQETQLRAWSEDGRHSATIWRDELEGLIRADLMEQGHGYADVRATELGRQEVGATYART